MALKQEVQEHPNLLYVCARFVFVAWVCVRVWKPSRSQETGANSQLICWFRHSYAPLIHTTHGHTVLPSICLSPAWLWILSSTKWRSSSVTFLHHFLVHHPSLSLLLSVLMVLLVPVFQMNLTLDISITQCSCCHAHSLCVLVCLHTHPLSFTNWCR